MRLIPAAALLLPLAAADQFQVPFSSQFNNLWKSISGYIPNSAGSIPTSFSSSLHTKPIANLTAQTWAADLSAHRAAPWLILVTGGNNTCGTHNASCARIDAAWTTASAAARTDPKSPNLGFVDCETNRLLCATWGAYPGTVWWIEPEIIIGSSQLASVTLRRADTEGAESLDIKPTENLDVLTHREIWVVGLNKTTVTPADITDLYRKRDEYKNRGHVLSHEDLFSRHPFSGQLARLGLNVPVGYLFFLLGMIPSWTTIMMIGFTARMFLNKAKGPTPAQKAQQAEKAFKEKFQENGKVKGAPPGDGTYH